MTTKAHFAIKNFTETDLEYPGSFSLILSDPTLDRDDEVVDAKCFTVTKSLPERISMDLDHEMTVLSTVGSGVPSYTPEGSLLVEGTWAATDKAQEARSLVRDGHIMYASVAYRTLQSKRDAKGIRHITDAELLNGTFTQIPANPNSRIITSKVGARNSKSDATNIQAAHDAMVAVGATCGEGKAHRPAGMKSIVGSVEALQDRVRDALEDAYVDETQEWGCVMLRGTLPDTVIFCGYGCPALESDETYRQQFTDDGSIVTLVGDAVIVDIAEIVTPDADASREPVDAVGVAAKAATTSADADVLALRARSIRLAATASFA